MTVESIGVPLTNEGLVLLPSLCELSARPERTRTWPVIDGVFVNPHIQDYRHEDFPVNPVIDGSVCGLGSVALTDIRHTGGTTPDSPIRTHREYKTLLNDFEYSMEITDPPNAPAEYTLYSFPGFTESSKGNVRQALHARLAQEFPLARVVSIGTNGIGDGDSFSWRERNLHGIDAMGSQRLALAKALSGTQPVFVMGTSMGGAISQHMTHENYYGTPVNGPVDIAGLIWLAPALVDPKNINDVALRFFPEFGKDVAINFILKKNPMELAHFIGMVSSHGLRRKDLMPLLSQLQSLHDGTVEQKISEVIDKVPVVVVAGEKDSLAQWPMLQRLEEQHGSSQLELNMVPGRGHSLSIDVPRAGEIIGPAGRKQIELALAKRAFSGITSIDALTVPPKRGLVLCAPLSQEPAPVQLRKPLNYDLLHYRELNLRPLLDPTFYLEEAQHLGINVYNKAYHLSRLPDLRVSGGELHWRYPAGIGNLLRLVHGQHSPTPVLVK